MTVAYKLGVFLGEPTVRGEYQWTGPAGAGEDCLPAGMSLWLKIQNDSTYGFVESDPVVPKAGSVSYSGTVSSPNWDEFICSYRGHMETNCFDADTAKRFSKRVKWLISRFLINSDYSRAGMLLWASNGDPILKPVLKF